MLDRAIHWILRIRAFLYCQLTILVAFISRRIIFHCHFIERVEQQQRARRAHSTKLLKCDSPAFYTHFFISLSIDAKRQSSRVSISRWRKKKVAHTTIPGALSSTFYFFFFFTLSGGSRYKLVLAMGKLSRVTQKPITRTARKMSRRWFTPNRW